MSNELNQTHDPALRSWVDSANGPGADFPIQNLPLGAFVRAPADRPRLGAAIGDQILDLWAAAEAGLLTGPWAAACQELSLNRLLAMGQPAWSALRAELSGLLRAESRPRPELLAPQAAAELLLPAQIGDYTDAYASVFHATNVGRLFRPDNPLLPNYKHVPIAYHGRASSVVVSGTPVRRPLGQRGPAGEGAAPTFGPSANLDYEAEVGALIGPGNPLGLPIPIGAAGAQLFGLVLVNDWSARDIQRWEYQPLGPFLSKSFATSISPWVVTMEALAPFRVPAFARPAGDPAPLPYLLDPDDQRGGGVDLTVEVLLSSARMRAEGHAPLRLSRGSLADIYWTLAQLLTHHASNGCNLRPGDLIASGTISGPTADSRACLLELTEGGRQPIALPTGEERRFLADGDEVTMRGFCERPGFARVGFGDCVGQLLPAAPE